MALFTAEDEIVRRAFDVLVAAGLFELMQHLRDVLEADEQVVNDLRLEMACDARHQVRRDESLHDDGPARHRAILGQLRQLEVRQERPDLIAREEVKMAYLVRGHRAETIGIGIGGQDEVRLQALRQRLGPVHRFRKFGIGQLGHVRELPVRLHLLLDGTHAEALLHEHLHRRHAADALQRREDDLNLVEARRLDQALLTAHIDVRLVRNLIERMHLAAANSLRPGEFLDERDLFDEVGHDLIVGRHGLAAALVIELAAVIVGRIVRRADVESALPFEVPNRER